MSSKHNHGIRLRVRLDPDVLEGLQRVRGGRGADRTSEDLVRNVLTDWSERRTQADQAAA